MFIGFIFTQLHNRWTLSKQYGLVYWFCQHIWITLSFQILTVIIYLFIYKQSASLTDIDNQLNDDSVLDKQDNNGVWLLNAGITIDKGALNLRNYSVYCSHPVDSDMQSTKAKIESYPVPTQLATKTDLSQQETKAITEAVMI